LTVAPRQRAVRGGVGLLIALSIAANGLGQGFSRFTYALLLPDMRADIIHSYGLAGLLGTFNLVAYLAGVLLVSALSGRVSPIRIVCIGLALCAVASVVLAAAPDYGILALGMVLLGGGAAGTWVPLAAVVSASVDHDKRGAALGALTTGFGAAILLAAQLRSLVYALAGDGSWRLVWLVEAALIAATCAACVAWFRPSAEATAARVASPLVLLRSIPAWGRLTLAYVALALGYIIYLSFLSALLETEAHASARHTSTVFSLIGISSIVGSVVTGRLADRFGWRSTYVLSSSVMTVCGLLALARREPWVSASAVMFGLPLTTTGALIVGYLGDYVRGPAIAAVFGVITLPFGVAQAAGPWIGGWLRDASGSFTATFLLASAALALAALSASTLPRGRPLLEAPAPRRP